MNTYEVNYLSFDNTPNCERLTCETISQVWAAFDGIHVTEIRDLDCAEAQDIAGRLSAADAAGIDALNYQSLGRRVGLATGKTINGQLVVTVSADPQKAEDLAAMREEQYISDRGDAHREVKFGKGL
jgi:hypothetical protein